MNYVVTAYDAPAGTPTRRVMAEKRTTSVSRAVAWAETLAPAGSEYVASVRTAGNRTFIGSARNGQFAFTRSDRETEMPTAKTKPSVHTCYVWLSSSGKTQTRKPTYKTAAGAAKFAAKESARRDVLYVTVLDPDGTRTKWTNGKLDAAEEAAPAPAAAQAVRKARASIAVTVTRPVAGPKIETKTGAIVRLLDYKDATTKAAQALPEGARWVAYCTTHGELHVFDDEPTDAELQKSAKWCPGCAEAKAA